MGGNQLELNAGDRVLVLAPHPDDETLAAGALIQLAIAAGAAVRVVIATDGDNNPWPQRWVERRWRLGPGRRGRWGARRRLEAQRATQALGVDPDDVVFLGWPDQQVTDLLLEGTPAQRQLLAQIVAFAPTHAVVPTLEDRHPDHSALRVLFEIAVLGTAFQQCQRLGFVLHADEATGSCVGLSPDAIAQARKLMALEAYVSQLSLSRRRMLGWARRRERFASAPAHQRSRGELMPLHTLAVAPWCCGWREHRLLLVLVSGPYVVRMALEVPAMGAERTEMIAGLPGASVRVRSRALAVDLQVTDPKRLMTHGFVKLERSGARLFIFDYDGWHDLSALPAASHSAVGMKEARRRIPGPA